jgi:rhodanese-related sulfurtransferase
MRKAIRLMIVLLPALALLAACQAGTTTQQIGVEAQMNGKPYRVVTMGELQTMLESKDFYMVNVQKPFEASIPQTDLHLPYDEIGQSLEMLPADKSTTLMIYCFTSGMAKIAVATLIEQGYTDIWMLDGGTIAWEGAGLPLEK